MAREAAWEDGGGARVAAVNVEMGGGVERILEGGPVHEVAGDGMTPGQPAVALGSLAGIVLVEEVVQAVVVQWPCRYTVKYNPSLSVDYGQLRGNNGEEKTDLPLGSVLFPSIHGSKQGPQNG
jgi:hypothetical protein